MSVDTTKSVSISTTPYAFLLFIVFLVLKLTDTIDWSWWWVTAPLWIGFAFFAAFFVLFAVVALPVLGIAKVLDNRKRRKRIEARRNRLTRP